MPHLLCIVDREFELRLPRSEVEEVDQLRERWQQLMNLADQVRMILLKERREAFGQELDKQVKVCPNFQQSPEGGMLGAVTMSCIFMHGFYKYSHFLLQ